jgi:hypothetical protein
VAQGAFCLLGWTCEIQVLILRIPSRNVAKRATSNKHYSPRRRAVGPWRWFVERFTPLCDASVFPLSSITAAFPHIDVSGNPEGTMRSFVSYWPSGAGKRMKVCRTESIRLFQANRIMRPSSLPRNPTGTLLLPFPFAWRGRCYSSSCAARMTARFGGAGFLPNPGSSLS